MVSGLNLSTPGVDFDAYTQENMQSLDAALNRYRSAYGSSQ